MAKKKKMGGKLDRTSTIVKNRERRLKRHLKNHPNDEQSGAAFDKGLSPRGGRRRNGMRRSSLQIAMDQAKSKALGALRAASFGPSRPQPVEVESSKKSSSKKKKRSKKPAKSDS